MSEYDEAVRRGSLLHMAELTDSSLLEIYGELTRRDAVVAAQGDSGGSTGAPAGGAPPLLTAGDVAAALGIPKAAVYEAARRKEIGSIRVSVGSRSGRSVRFSRDQVEAFKAARSVAAKAR
jgi:excisionase family DNA binding protein